MFTVAKIIPTSRAILRAGCTTQAERDARALTRRASFHGSSVQLILGT